MEAFSGGSTVGESSAHGDAVMTVWRAYSACRITALL